MKKNIIIKGKPFEYESVKISTSEINAITFEDAKKLLFAAKAFLDEKGIRFFLAYGTLLGAIREHSFISHDYDIDIATPDIDKLIESIPEWYSKGFKLCRVIKDVYSFKIDNTYIDIYVVRKPRNILFCWNHIIVGDGCMPSRFYKSFKKIDFLGKDFMIPSRAEDLLEYMYGETWRTPIKGASGKYFSNSYLMYKKAKKTIKKTFFKIIRKSPK